MLSFSCPESVLMLVTHNSRYALIKLVSQTHEPSLTASGIVVSLQPCNTGTELQSKLMLTLTLIVNKAVTAKVQLFTIWHLWNIPFKQIFACKRIAVAIHAISCIRQMLQGLAWVSCSKEAKALLLHHCDQASEITFFGVFKQLLGILNVSCQAAIVAGIQMKKLLN